MWLQLLFYNRKRAIRRMDGCNWRRINSIPLKIEAITKCLFQRKTVPLKMQNHCKWPPKIMMLPLKYIVASAPLKLQYALNRYICQIHCIYTIHGYKCCSKINTGSIKEWIAATNFVKSRYAVPWKKLLNIKN